MNHIVMYCDDFVRTNARVDLKLIKNIKVIRGLSQFWAASRLVILMVFLNGCATTLPLQTVSSSFTAFDEVLVVALTPDSARAANASPYTARQLPAAFSLDNNSARQTQRPSASTWPSAADRQDYQIGPGDVLSITTPTPLLRTDLGLAGTGQGFENSAQVDTDGNINLPVLGQLAVADLKLSQAQALIQERLLENAIDPQFQVLVVEFNARQVTVSGAVRNPQVIPIRLDPLTVSQALATVGGAATESYRGLRVRLLRGDQRFEVDLIDLLENRDLGDVPLQDKDNLIVFADDSEETNARARGDERQIDADVRGRFGDRDSLGAVDRDKVYIAGEVESQRIFLLPFATKSTLADALFDDSNGVAPERGNPAQIYLLRLNSEDRVVAYHLSAANAADLLLATIIELRPNDIVFVSERPIAAWNRIIQALFPTPVFGLANLSNL